MDSVNRLCVSLLSFKYRCLNIMNDSLVNMQKFEEYNAVGLIFVFSQFKLRVLRLNMFFTGHVIKLRNRGDCLSYRHFF